jgi:autotransporter-associated beta strand protein
MCEMKKINVCGFNLKVNCSVIILIVAVAAGSVFAQTVVWDGDNGVDANWSTGGNWIGGSAPAGATNLTLQFEGNVNMGTENTPLNQDISDPFKLNRIDTVNVASGDKNIYLDGDPLQFSADLTTQPLIHHDRENVLYIYNEVKIPAGTYLDHTIRTYGMEHHGIITGEGALRFSTIGGAGELNLHNSDNTYSGGTVYVNTRGTDASWSRLKVYASNALGSGPVSISGGNLKANGATQAAGLTFYRSTTHTNDFLLQAASPIFAGVMNGAEYPADESVSLSGDVDLNSYTLYLRGHRKSEGFLSGVISEGGADALKKIDPGAWTLSGDNTFTGKVTVADGTLKSGTASAIPAGVPLSVEGGLFDLNGFTVTNSAVTLSSGSISNGILVADSFTLSGGDLSATLAGNGGITKTGTDTASLSVSNLYSGATAINEGTLRFAQRTALYNGITSEWTADNISVSSGATMYLNAGGTGEFTDSDVATLSGLGTATGGFQSGSVLTLDTTNAANGVFFCESVTLGNAGGNGLSVTKLGPGTLVMGDDNSYTGVTRLEEGTLSTAVLADGGTVSGIGAATTDNNNLIFAGGELKYTGPSVTVNRAFRINSGTNAIFDVTEADTKLSFLNFKESYGPGSCALVKNGAGTLEIGLDGPGGDVWAFKATIRAIIINGGTFTNISDDEPQINVNTTLASGPALVFGDGAVLGCEIPLANLSTNLEQVIQYIGTSTTAEIQAGVFSGPYADGESNTKVFDINDGAAEIDLLSTANYSTYSPDGQSVNARSNIRKTGAGTLKFSGTVSRFRGVITIRDGRIIVGNNVPFGGNSVLGNATSVVQLADSATADTNHVALVFDGAYTFSRGICVNPFGASATIGNISTNTAIFDGAILISNTVQLVSATAADNSTRFNGIISGPGGVTAIGTGTVVLAASNTYTGLTTVADGTLKLSEANRIADTSSLRLTGGTFDTAGYNETMNTLDVDGNAVLDFGNGSSEIHFSASALESWEGTLLIVNRTEGSDRLFVGTDASGLTEVQLSKIIYPNGQPAVQLQTGEVVPLPMGTLILVR